MVTKTTRHRHFDQTKPRMTFADAYRYIKRNQARVYLTTGNKTSFTATAQTAVRGAHPGQSVIVFRSNGIERARVYKCCWAHRTNCNRAYVDCYVLAI